MKAPVSALLACGLCVAAAAQAGAEGIPVSPITPTALHGHTNALVIRNRLLEVAVLPALGRIAGFRFGGLDNVVRFDGALAAIATNPPAPDTWRNLGGDWLFPVSQAHWEKFFGRRWPPHPFLDGLPWEGHAWRSDDGAQHILMSIEIGEPLHVLMRRSLQLDPDAAALTIRQRIERTAPSAIPMTLWNISQIPGAQRVLLPVDGDSTFADGYAVLDFGPPASHLLDRVEDSVLVLDVKNGTEHKLGTDSPRGWIAAQRDQIVLLERAETRHPGGDFPDGGCRSEVYANSGLVYTEIETLSEERILHPGEAMENTLTLSFHHVDSSLDNTGLVRRVREILGEIPASH